LARNGRTAQTCERQTALAARTEQLVLLHEQRSTIAPIRQFNPDFGLRLT